MTAPCVVMLAPVVKAQGVAKAVPVASVNVMVVAVVVTAVNTT